MSDDATSPSGSAWGRRRQGPADGGHARSVSAQTNGSGDLSFGGEADSLSAMINGSGDVHVARVSGAVSKVVHGSGDVTTGR